ncbi:hypothetical protein [Ornithinibacillus sp. JPR2-1]
MKKLRHGNYMLYRVEDGQKVWIYGYFQWQELKKKIKNGWRVWE